MKREIPYLHLDNILRLYEALKMLSMKDEFLCVVQIMLNQAFTKNRDLLQKLGVLRDFETVFEAITNTDQPQLVYKRDLRSDFANSFSMGLERSSSEILLYY